MGKYHDRTYPGESDVYRQKRDELLAAEIELRRKTLEVAALRRELPDGGEVPEDYVFDEVDLHGGPARQVRFSELFDPHSSSLIVYNFMYGPDWDAPCPLCTSIIDAGNGMAPHIRAKTNYVVVAKAGADKLQALAAERGWRNIRFLSSLNNDFNRHYFAEYEGRYGNHHPLMNVFVKRDDGIRHFWSSELFFTQPEPGFEPQHVDLVWPLWHYLDMTAEGRGDFHPKLAY